MKKVQIIILISIVILLVLGVLCFIIVLNNQTHTWSNLLARNSGPSIRNPATETEQITVTDITRSGDNDIASLQVGFYCDSATPCAHAVPSVECNGINITYAGISQIGTSLTVPAHNNKGYIVNINKINMNAGTHPCTVKVDSMYSPGQPWAKQKQIMLTIT